MLQKFISVLIISVFLLLYSSISYALPINFDEEMYGDINENGVQTFSLDIGSNIISGASKGGSLIDSDSFKFLLPENTVSSFNFTFNIDMGGSPYSFSSTWELSKLLPSSVSCGPVCGHFFQPIAGEVAKGGNPLMYLLPNSSIKFSEVGLLDSGLYSISEIGIGYGLAPAEALDYEYTVNYSFSIDVQSVPEPGSLILLSIGLVGFASIKSSRNT